MTLAPLLFSLSLSFSPPLSLSPPHRPPRPARAVSSVASFEGFYLPPSRAGRDLAAEAVAAAEGLAIASGLHPEDRPSSSAPPLRPLRVLSLPANEMAWRFSRHLAHLAAAAAESAHGDGKAMVELVSEEVSQITNGRLQGSTWLKPVAMRVLKKGGGATHYALFGTLVPNLVAPTSILLSIDVTHASVLRMMHHVHVSQDVSTAPLPTEVRLLHLFSRLIEKNRRSRPGFQIEPARE